VIYPGYQPRLLLRSFDELPEEARAAGIARLVDQLAWIDTAWLRMHPEVPPLYESGVVYVERGLTACGDDWRDIPEILVEGEGVCEDLSAWRIAELRIRSTNAQPLITSMQADSLIVYHVRVLWPNGQIEDPSLILGMSPLSPDAQSVVRPGGYACSPSSCSLE